MRYFCRNKRYLSPNIRYLSPNIRYFCPLKRYISPLVTGGEIQKVAYADSEVQATMLASTPANGIQHGGAGNLKCVRNAKAAFEKNLLPPGETAFRTRPTIGVATQREQIRAVP